MTPIPQLTVATIHRLSCWYPTIELPQVSVTERLNENDTGSKIVATLSCWVEGDRITVTAEHTDMELNGSPAARINGLSNDELAGFLADALAREIEKKRPPHPLVAQRPLTVTDTGLERDHIIQHLIDFTSDHLHQECARMLADEEATDPELDARVVPALLAVVVAQLRQVIPHQTPDERRAFLITLLGTSVSTDALLNPTGAPAP